MLSCDCTTRKMPKIRPLPDVLQKIAIEELNEVPDRISEDIETLKTWIQQQPHLNARTDDQFLVAFLRGCKYSLEKAKTKIENFYALRCKYPEFYTIRNFDDPRVLEMIRYGVGIPLPIPLNENGPRIQLIRPGCYPPDRFSIEEVMPLAHTFALISILEDDHANVNGFIDIMDMRNTTAAHMLQMTPSVVKKITVFTEDAMPLRQKSAHFINTGTGFETLFNWLKPMIPQKQQERLFVHGNDLAKLYFHIPQKYLPKEYGGENGSLPEIIAQSEKLFFEYRQFFIDDRKYGIDESQRSGKVYDYDSVFGIDGSFRKISFD